MDASTLTARLSPLTFYTTMSFFSAIFGTQERSDKSKFETLRDDGVRAMQMGEFPYAEKCFRAALEIDRELRTVGFLAEACLRMGHFADALPLLEEISGSDARSLDSSLLLAQTQGGLEQYEAQLATCNDILDQNPEEPRALFLSAQALHGLGRDPEAIAKLVGALELRPGFRSAQLLRAQILQEMGQWNEAFADADTLVKEEPDNEEYLALRADALTALGRTDEAIADYETIRTLNPFNQEAVLKLGKVYEATTRWDKALALYDEAIELSPDFAEAYRARGGVKYHLKDQAGAMDDLKRSLELDPEKAKELDGEFSNVENQMNERYRNLNPFSF